jgi:hypothetical protein
MLTVAVCQSLALKILAVLFVLLRSQNRNWG